MTVYIPYSETAKTGKGIFLKRLADQALSLGVSVVSDQDRPHDVSLHLIKLKNSKSKRILRLDGIYHNTDQDYKARNKEIAKHVLEADGVIYQGIFSKSMADKYLGQANKPTACIHNGASAEFYDNINPAISDFEKNFITVSRWRPHKRLSDSIESFLLADVSDSCLWIAGNVEQSNCKLEKYAGLKNVKLLGTVDQKTLGSYYKACSASIHLCWVDCCPNSVVESIAAGCPVICNNVGGTRELVDKAGGIVCDVDEPYDMSPVKLYQPPKMDRNIIAAAIQRSSVEKIQVNRESVSIKNTAIDYIEMFTIMKNLP